MTDQDRKNGDQAKADDIRKMTDSQLLKKYPHDPVIFNAIATKQAARQFAEEHLGNKRTRAAFVNQAVERFAENVEKGKKVPEVKMQARQRDDIQR